MPFGVDQSPTRTEKKSAVVTTNFGLSNSRGFSRQVIHVLCSFSVATACFTAGSRWRGLARK